MHDVIGGPAQAAPDAEVNAEVFDAKEGHDLHLLRLSAPVCSAAQKHDTQCRSPTCTGIGFELAHVHRVARSAGGSGSRRRGDEIRDRTRGWFAVPLPCGHAADTGRGPSCTDAVAA